MNKKESINKIVEEANRGELVFSSNVAASLKIQQTLGDPDCSIDMATKLIMNEPLLSARVVAMANTIAFNHGNQVTNVKTAITRLGFRSLQSILSSIIMKQLAGASKNPDIRTKADLLWKHSAQVAALAQVIAKRTTKLDPDTALFAGIVHEVGGFYLLSRLEEFPRLLDPDETPPYNEEQAFTGTLIDPLAYKSEIIIGRIVLKNLNLPAQVGEAVEALWYGFSTMPPKSLGDTLILANELATSRSPMEVEFLSSAEENPVYIDFVIGNITLASILEESEKEVKSLTAAILA